MSSFNQVLRQVGHWNGFRYAPLFWSFFKSTASLKACGWRQRGTTQCCSKKGSGAKDPSMDSMAPHTRSNKALREAALSTFLTKPVPNTLFSLHQCYCPPEQSKLILSSVNLILLFLLLGQLCVKLPIVVFSKCSAYSFTAKTLQQKAWRLLHRNQPIFYKPDPINHFSHITHVCFHCGTLALFVYKASSKTL